MDEMKRIQDAAEKVLSVCGKADIGIILGSGLGDYADALEDAVKLPYSEIPGFPRSTVAGHAGMWCCGTLHGKRVVMMQGRFHYYEGYSMKDVTLPVRVMQKIGVKTLIVTNAAGCVRTDWQAGDLMLITDSGVIIRIPAQQISVQSRYAGGVKVMRLEEDTRIIGIATVERDDEAEDLSSEEGQDGSPEENGAEE